MILILAAAFVILFILLGGDRGLRSLGALVINVIIFLLDIKALQYGLPAYLVTLVTVALMSMSILFLQNGYNLKTRATLLSLAVVTVFIFLLALVIAHAAKISGYNELNMYEDETAMLAGHVSINMTAAAVAMVIVGIVGAVIDVAIAVSSAVYEVEHKNPELTERELFASGLRMGGSIMETTVNTLLFAGIGESLLMYLEMKELHYSFGQLLNSKAFFQMLFPVMMSAIGCVCIVPVAAWIMGNFVKKYQ